MVAVFNVAPAAWTAVALYSLRALSHATNVLDPPHAPESGNFALLTPLVVALPRCWREFVSPAHPNGLYGLKFHSSVSSGGMSLRNRDGCWNMSPV
jgi:hypothetical protein